MVKLKNCNTVVFAPPSSGHPIRYFVEGMLAAVNHSRSAGYERTSAIGLSGGGWTVTLYAALDVRMAHSYPVAGSYPIYLRALRNRAWRDFEQLDPGLYSEVNHLELYLLGASGEGRKQIQCLNEFDPCCFNGRLYLTYEAHVAARVEVLGPGSFSVFLDSSHEDHKNFLLTLHHIMADLALKDKPN